ncbi:MrpH family fimbial adhesin [Providencia hangzhouensis]|uniref:MrpH family fimbial adhesin n=1 Tax=Providencia hangzhouensis TaxID=3031799 RepID=UPI00280C4652
MLILLKNQVKVRNVIIMFNYAKYFLIFVGLIFFVSNANSENLKPVVTSSVLRVAPHSPDQVIHTISWSSFSVSDEDANRVVYCPAIIGSLCGWGFVYRQTNITTGVTATWGFRGGYNGLGINSLYTINIKNGQTMGDAYKAFIAKFGASGTAAMIRNHNNRLGENYRYAGCFALLNSSDNTLFDPPNNLECLDTPIDPIPMSCQFTGPTGGDTVNLDHGIVSTGRLNGNQASAKIGVKCTENASVSFSFTETTLQLGTNLSSTLSLKRNGMDIPISDSPGSNNSQKIDKNILTYIDVISTLSAAGTIAPDRYTGSSTLVVTLN